MKTKQKIEFFSVKHPPATPECSQKISVHSVQPFGRLLVTYIYTNVLFYYIDCTWIRIRGSRKPTDPDPKHWIEYCLKTYFLLRFVAAEFDQVLIVLRASLVETWVWGLIHPESRALPFRSPRFAALLPQVKIFLSDI